MKRISTTLFLVLGISFSTLADPPETESGNSEVQATVTTGPTTRVRPGRHAEDSATGGIYTPQQAVSDILSETLVFVGRGIPDPILDDNGAVITDGASQYCVWKNSRIYVIQQGCREEVSLPISVLSIEVFSRSGGAVQFYLEANSNYNLTMLETGSRGVEGRSWRVSVKFTSAISGEPGLNSFFEYYNRAGGTTVQSCAYSIFNTLPVASPNPQLICSPRSLENNTWKSRVAEFWSAPLNNRFREAHDAVKNGSR